MESHQPANFQMEPTISKSLGLQWSEAEIAAMSNDDRFFEKLCEKHPGFREAAHERRAYYRQKREELGSAYPEWFFTEHVCVRDITTVVRGPLRTINSQGEYHANT